MSQWRLFQSPCQKGSEICPSELTHRHGQHCVCRLSPWVTPMPEDLCLVFSSPDTTCFRPLPFSPVSGSETQSGNRAALPITWECVRRWQPTCFLGNDLDARDVFICSPFWVQHSPFPFFLVDYVVLRAEQKLLQFSVFLRQGLVYLRLPPSSVWKSRLALVLPQSLKRWQLESWGTIPDMELLQFLTLKAWRWWQLSTQIRQNFAYGWRAVKAVFWGCLYIFLEKG